jgi:tripartite-type tricarboxylate transporter receptor subunit TctC
MLAVLEAPLAIGQAFYVAREVPKERVEALRDAFNKMLVDPEFVAETQKIKLYVNPSGPGQIAKAVSEVYGTPKEILAELDALLAPK